MVGKAEELDWVVRILLKASIAEERISCSYVSKLLRYSHDHSRSLAKERANQE